MTNNASSGVDEPRPIDISRNDDCSEVILRVEEPEGGLWPWLAALGSFLIYLASFGVINSFGFFQSYYQRESMPDYPPSVIALIGSLQISLMYLAGPVSGALTDAYGPQYLYMGAALICTASLVIVSFTKQNEIWLPFVFQGVIFGLAVGFAVKPASTVVLKQFKSHQALAMGIVASGSSVGGVCFPIMLEHLFAKVGFAWSMRIVAVIFLGCCMVSVLVTRLRHAQRPLRSMADLLDFKGCLDIRYSVLAAGTCVASFGLYLPYYYAGQYGAFIDPASSLSSYLLPLLNAASFFGRVIGGQIADKMGRLNFLYPMIVFSGLLCLAIWLLATNMATLVAFVCLYGFSSGVFISVTPSAVSQILPEDKLGARGGAFFSFTAIATLAGTPLGGVLILDETKKGYTPMVIFSGCTLLVGAGVIFISRCLHDKSLLRKW